MSDNIYQSPQSSVVDDDTGELTLASRWSRLGASIIDGVLMVVVVMPLAFFLGAFEAIEQSGEMGIGPTIALGIASIGAFFLFNGYLLSTNGQTVGKKLMNIKIVDLNGNNMPFGRLIGMRYIPVWIVSYIPIVGSFTSLIDALFIFRADKRCVHDLIAGTQVVNA